MIATALELLGVGLLLVGLYLWWPPLALVVGGIILVGIAALYERERKARHDDSATGTGSD